MTFKVETNEALLLCNVPFRRPGPHLTTYMQIHKPNSTSHTHLAYFSVTEKKPQHWSANLERLYMYIHANTSLHTRSPGWKKMGEGKWCWICNLVSSYVVPYFVASLWGRPCSCEEGGAGELLLDRNQAMVVLSLWDGMHRIHVHRPHSMHQSKYCLDDRIFLKPISV